MAITDEFINYCTQTLEINFGTLASELITKVKAKKNLDDRSNTSDFKEFIDLIELNISVLAGKNKATDICNSFRKKAVEITESQRPQEALINNDIDAEISAFLAKNSLPTEGDITDYSKYLAMKYGGNAKKVEKDIIEKVKAHVKLGVSRKKISEEASNFLSRYPQPTSQDIEDFKSYLRLLKLNFKEDELLELIEKERLCLKFHGEPRMAGEASELDEFIDIFKRHNKNDISSAMQKQEISYLIKDESGVSDELLSEFVDLMKPNENDMRDALEGLGLKHMIRKP